jgi:hypothetical protein
VQPLQLQSVSEVVSALTLLTVSTKFYNLLNDYSSCSIASPDPNKTFVYQAGFDMDVETLFDFE